MIRSVNESNPNARHEHEGRYRSANHGRSLVGQSEGTRPAVSYADEPMPDVTGAQLLKAAAVTKAQKLQKAPK